MGTVTDSLEPWLLTFEGIVNCCSSWLLLLLLLLLQSKASPLGAVLSMAAAGKRSSKKQLGLMMQAAYGDHLYVASVCLEANHNQVRDDTLCILVRGLRIYPCNLLCHSCSSCC
jgi:hypothetical protein